MTCVGSKLLVFGKLAATRKTTSSHFHPMNHVQFEDSDVEITAGHARAWTRQCVSDEGLACSNKWVKIF